MGGGRKGGEREGDETDWQTVSVSNGGSSKRQTEAVPLRTFSHEMLITKKKNIHTIISVVIGDHWNHLRYSCPNLSDFQGFNRKLLKFHSLYRG